MATRPSRPSGNRPVRPPSKPAVEVEDDDDDYSSDEEEVETTAARPPPRRPTGSGGRPSRPKKPSLVDVAASLDDEEAGRNSSKSALLQSVEEDRRKTSSTSRNGRPRARPTNRGRRSIASTDGGQRISNTSSDALLRRAATRGSISEARRLLRDGADPDSTDEVSYELLFFVGLDVLHFITNESPAVFYCSDY
jgi:hypothetical protein